LEKNGRIKKKTSYFIDLTRPEILFDTVHDIKFNDNFTTF
jgi:hypothetical protein